MKEKLIVNADDYGLTESCSKAIAEAFEKNLISSTTACANGEYIEEAFAFSQLVEKGSTVITFTKAYMESLSEGEHTFELVFRDGSIPAKVVITAAEENMNSGNATGTDTPSDSKEPSGSGEPADSDTEDTSVEKNTETSVDASKSETVGSTAAETGDSGQPVLWLVLAMLATMAGVVILNGKRNKR